MKCKFIVLYIDCKMDNYNGGVLVVLFVFFVLFAFAALYAFRQKILYLTVYRAEVIFRPGGNFGIELV